MSQACPPGNLLAGRNPAGRLNVRGQLALVTDGAATAEGALWNAAPAVILDTPASTLTYDLGSPVSVRAVYLQADANDTYTLFGSLDGRAFAPLAQAPIKDGHGLRGRTLELPGAVVRFLRVGEGKGDSYYSISELQAFCQVPTPFPPALRIVAAPQAAVAPAWWNDTTSARFEMGLALAGLALLGWGFWLSRQGRGADHRRLRDRLLMALGIVSAGAYINFGSFHFDNFIHSWDTFHYYVGAKYFREIGYFRLYECVAVGDAESGLRREVELRKMTNLRTNVLESSTDILAHPERCKAHFSPDRWESFKRDISYFRRRVSAKNWNDTQTDHGYNGTPVWNVLGTVLANLAPANHLQITLLDVIDQVYLLGMAAIVWWAFGWRVLCVALLVFATNFPSRYYWTGGSFLRQDWLFYTVAGVCLARRERYLLGGMALAYAALLRIFPVFLLVGPALVVARGLITRQPLDRRYLSLFAGAALGVGLLVPVSFAVSGGIPVYIQFVQNTQKHKETPLTNYMGLRTLAAYRPSEVGRHLKNEKLEDPWSVWKEARLRAYRQVRVLYFVAVAAFLALLAASLRGGPEPWVACAMSASLIAVGVELTCYYYSFLVAVSVLHEKRREVGLALLAVTATTGFMAWAPLRIMPTWIDEQYTAMSWVTVAGLVLILYVFANRAGREDLEAAEEAAGEPAENEDLPAPREKPSAGPAWWRPRGDHGHHGRHKKRRR